VDPVTKKREYRDDYDDKTLYIPGPTEVREDVIEAMTESTFGHRMDRMTDLYTTIVVGTRRSSSAPTTTWSSSPPSGTEFWEASTLNLVDENILVPTCGSFSERHANVAERLGKDVDRLEYEWGEAVKPEDIREHLESTDKHYDVVATVMNESSTGVRNPIEEIGDVIADYPDTYFVVDARLRARRRLRRHRQPRHRRDLRVHPEGVRDAAGAGGLRRQRRRLRSRG